MPNSWWRFYLDFGPVYHHKGPILVLRDWASLLFCGLLVRGNGLGEVGGHLRVHLLHMIGHICGFGDVR